LKSADTIFKLGKVEAQYPFDDITTNLVYCFVFLYWRTGNPQVFKIG